MKKGLKTLIIGFIIINLDMVFVLYYADILTPFTAIVGILGYVIGLTLFFIGFDITFFTTKPHNQKPI